MPNVEKIVAVWEKESGLCGRVLLEEGRNGERLGGCAIGSLLWASPRYEAGPDRLRRVRTAFAGGQTLHEAYAILEDEYGLVGQQVQTVIGWNDRSFNGDAARRDYMIAKVREEWGGT